MGVITSALPAIGLGLDRAPGAPRRSGRHLLALLRSAGLPMFLLAVPLGAAPGLAQQVDTKLWGMDNNITGIARRGNTVYVAGAFTNVGPNTGSGVPLSRASGEVPPSYAAVAGPVQAVISDGSGGWFLGGTFVGVGGLPRLGLAHILADGRVADWGPAVDGEVLALALAGNTLYVGGSFTRVGGVERSHLAAVDAVTGAVDGWSPTPDQKVQALLASDTTLYVGGDFGTIGGQVRHSLAEVDLVTGVVTAWDPKVGFSGGPGSVRALARIGETIYLGGMFGMVGGQFRYNVGAVDARTALPTDWNPWATSCNCNRYDGSPYVNELVPGDGTMYVGGHFSIVGGVDRGGIAEVDLESGQPTTWDPQVGPRYTDFAPRVTGLTLADTTVYLSGWFTSIGGSDRRYVAEVGRGTGVATTWAPGGNRPPEAIAVDGGVVYVGGIFTSMGQWKLRQNLAAIDAVTGEATAWRPDPNGLIVYSVAPAADRVYVAGHFSWIGGAERWGLAALDPVTGAALEWRADVNETPGFAAVFGDRLYVAGAFTTVRGVPRSRAASFDLATGELTGWQPLPNDDVLDMVVEGDTAYLVGWFSTVGGVARQRVAAVDAVTGEVRDWTGPAMDNWVHAVAVKDSTLFIGGAFRELDGLRRRRLAALDARTGEVRQDWIADVTDANPNVARVYDLEIVGSTLYVAGSFDSIAGQWRGGLAALDAETGRLLDWNPALRGPTPQLAREAGVVWGIAASGSTLYAGGRFLAAGSDPVAGLVGISLVPGEDPAPPPAPRDVAIVSLAPNPTRAETAIRFAVPANGPVSLAVYDVQGRRVAWPVRNELRSAGVHEVRLPTGGWAEGFYFCRLEIAGVAATRKLVVLK